jgi:Putative zinc-finger
MTAEGCRQRREELGAYALGGLSEPERTALEAHVEGCDACRAELDRLAPVAALLERADPARLEQAPRPPEGLALGVLGRIRDEQRAKRRRRVRWGFAFAGAAATIAVAVVLISSLGGSDAQEIPGVQKVSFETTEPGLHLSAALVPRAWGTEIHMYVKGAEKGELCSVWLRRADGARVPAGSFTYRYEAPGDVAILTSAIPTKRVRALGLQVGPERFVAEVPGRGAT